MLEILQRDGLARVAVYRRQSLVMRTPMCFHDLAVVTETLGIDISPVPPHPAKSEPSRAFEDFGDVVVVRNFNLWLERSDEFLKYLIEKRVDDPEKLLVLSGVRASHIPLCVYMGGDVLIPAYSLLLCSRGEVDTEVGRVPAGTWKSGDMSDHHLLDRAVAHLRAGTLREYVENWPEITARRAVRYMDHHLYPLLERVFPTDRDRISTPGLEGLFRPEVLRYMDRLESRYEHPEWKSLLLLPCSARKPYSLSRTHRKLSEALSLPARGVHEVVVTSPLGLVPRELESTFPARAYDVPVLGIWSAEERERVSLMLRKFVERGGYSTLYAALPMEMRWMETLLDDLGFSYSFYVDVAGLSHSEVSHALHSLGKDSRTSRMREYMRAVFLYRYGVPVMDVGVKQGRRWEISVLSGGEVIMRYRYDTGTAYLTRRGCEMLLREGAYTVDIHSFQLRGDLFVSGIREASPEIRPGDDVVLHSGGRLKGVGRALLSGHEMMRLGRGMAVKVRKRF